MMKFIRIIAAAACVIMALPASALDYSHPFNIAGVRVFNPTSAPHLGGGGHAFGPGYIPPILVNAFALAAMDSRTDFANLLPGGSPSSWSPSTNFGVSYAGWLYALSNVSAANGGTGGNLVIAENGYNRGIVSQTSAGALARQLSTGIACDIAAYSTYTLCYSGNVAATQTGTTVTAGTTIVLTGTPAVTVGMGIQSISNILPPGAVVASVSVAANTTITLQCTTPGTASCVTPVAAMTNQAMTFFPIGTSTTSGLNPYYTYLNAGYQSGTTNWGSGSDSSQTRNSDGLYNECTDPAVVEFIMGGTNDAANGISSIQSMTNLGAYLNNLGPSAVGGCNKIAIAGDELPRGMASGNLNNGPFLGQPTVGNSYTVAPVNAGNADFAASKVYDTQFVAYTPLPAVSATSPTTPASITLGTNDGTLLKNCTSNGAGAPNGAANCTPSTGQYTWNSSTNVYGFSSGDANNYIAAMYRWGGTANQYNLGASPNQQTYLHYWYQSAASDSYSTSNQHVPGAQSSRPWVHIAPTWATWADTSISSRDWQLPYMSIDGIHGTHYGDRLVANALLATAKAANAMSSTPPYPTSTVENPYFTGTTHASGSATGACSTSGTTTPANDTNLAHFVTAASPNTNLGLYTVGGTLYGAHPTPWGASGVYAVVDCIDTANNQMHVHPTSGSLASTGFVETWVEQSDANSYLPEGVFKYSNIWTTINSTTGLSNCVSTNNYCGVAGANGAATATANVPSCSAAPCTITGVTVSSGTLYPGSKVTGSGLTGTVHLLNAYVSIAGTGAPATWTLVVDQATTSATASTLTFTPPTIAFGVPNGWRLSQANLATNITSSTGPLAVSLGVEQNPFGDGYDDFVITLSGHSTAPAPIIYLLSPQMKYTTNLMQQISQALSGMNLRGQCEVMIYPGPNGHLWGIQSAAIVLQGISTSNFTMPGHAGSSISTENATTGAGASVSGGISEYTDADGQFPITPGMLAPVHYDALTPVMRGDLMAAYVNTSAGTTITQELAINISASSAVSAMIRLRKCGLHQATNG